MVVILHRVVVVVLMVAVYIFLRLRLPPFVGVDIVPGVGRVRPRSRLSFLFLEAAPSKRFVLCCGVPRVRVKAASLRTLDFS